MRTATILTMLMTPILTMCAGCERADTPDSLAADGQKQPSLQTVEQSPQQAQTRAIMTAEDNPTTLANRGEPSLDDFFRPAAWIYIDGQEGRFVEEDGHPQVQWVIDGPVSPSPTFRVEVFEQLLGTPRDFSCALEAVEAADGSKVAYGIVAAEGAFEVGCDYSLLRPGDDFVVRNRVTGDVVIEMAPLAPGSYLLAAGIKNRQIGKEGVAITFFTVGEDQND